MAALAGRAAGGAPGPVIRQEIRVEGIVQGVGFRPYVWHLAQRHELAGWVLNSEQGVLIEVEGHPDSVAGFRCDLAAELPPLAVVTAIHDRVLDGPAGYERFEIIPSRRGEERTATVPADAATCPDCRREVLDPANRRHGYPFTNCTNCGPRFTIIRDLPYDRPGTTMASFAMCPACGREYHDPADRRFHAQPNACPVCGPQAQIVDPEGLELAGPASWPRVAAMLLRNGQILAVKGLGGYHLACNAADTAAVALLRERKARPHRPFAVMARDLGVVRRFCVVGPEEERLLTSPAAPIVLLKRLPGVKRGPVPDVALGLDTVGVMLPYTPLHLLLMAAGPEVLVMTSGNPTGLPLCIAEEEARERLGRIADAFLTHNRPIQVPCDDSVVQVADGAPAFLRRSRGYVPRPLTVPALAAAPTVLGAGGDLKNTFCLLDGARAVFSQHLGDMESEEAQANWRRALQHLQKLTGIEPAVVGHDMHPRYRSVAAARALGLQTVAVQHHHAHLAACMAENGLQGEAIGLVLDGTGYGPDGAIWGFEILAGGYEEARRIGHLAYSPLPGGEAAIRRPLMAAAGMLRTHLGIVFGDLPEVQLAVGLMRSGVNCPQVGSAGRLFDAAAAMLGICRLQTYEGQAAIELGAVARPSTSAYPFAWIGDALSPEGILEGLLRDLHRPDVAAGRFLATVAEMARAGARRAREETGLTAVCLSGGTWNSAWLVSRMTELLESDGFTVYRHRQLPTGDGGLALGQAMVARRRWQQHVSGDSGAGA